MSSTQEHQSSYPTISLAYFSHHSMINTSRDQQNVVTATPSEIGDIPVTPPPEPILSEVLNQSTVPHATGFLSITINKYTDAIRNGYKSDPLFSKALTISNTNSIYHLDPHSGLLYQNSPSGGVRLCVPNVKVPVHGRQERLRNVLIDHIHETLGHFGYKKTLSSAYRHFYWKTIVSDVIYRIRRCHDCQVNKSSPTARQGLAKPLPIAQRPWSIISMDFMNLPTSQDDAGNKFEIPARNWFHGISASICVRRERGNVFNSAETRDPLRKPYRTNRSLLPVEVTGRRSSNDIVEP